MSWGAYFAVMFATALKFIAGPITGFSLGLAWYETVFFTWLGAMLTVTIIVSIGQIILKSLSSLRKTKPLLFSKRVRYAVQIWQKFGIKGIAALTPLIFTPIGGSFWLCRLRSLCRESCYSWLFHPFCGPCCIRDSYTNSPFCAPGFRHKKAG